MIAESKPAILITKDLSVGYDKKVVVNNINFEVKKGEIICLMGSNGAGKTTILRTLSGLLKPVHGNVYIKGKPVRDYRKDELSKNVSVVLTEKISPGLFTCFEIASMGRYPHSGFFGKLTPSDIAIVKEAMRLVNAQNLSERYFHELSDGEKQKIMLARALVQEPEIIIMDEPTMHLDIKHKLELTAILNKLSRENGITIIISLHEIELALKTADKMVFVEKGEIKAYGGSEDILKAGTIEELYGLSNAAFNEYFCTVELLNMNKSTPGVFVVPGAGSGTRIFRSLARYNISVAAGIVHENDIDFETAKILCSKVISEKSFCSITEEKYDEALESIKDLKCIIDSGFSAGEINKKNIDLIKWAAKNDILVMSLRGREEGRLLFTEDAYKVSYFDTLNDLLRSFISNFEK